MVDSIVEDAICMHATNKLWNADPGTGMQNTSFDYSAQLINCIFVALSLDSLSLPVRVCQCKTNIWTGLILY